MEIVKENETYKLLWNCLSILFKQRKLKILNYLYHFEKIDCNIKLGSKYSISKKDFNLFSLSPVLFLYFLILNAIEFHERNILIFYKALVCLIENWYFLWKHLILRILQKGSLSKLYFKIREIKFELFFFFDFILNPRSKKLGFHSFCDDSCLILWGFSWNNSQTKE